MTIPLNQSLCLATHLDSHLIPRLVRRSSYSANGGMGGHDNARHGAQVSLSVSVSVPPPPTHTHTLVFLDAGHVDRVCRILSG